MQVEEFGCNLDRLICGIPYFVDSAHTRDLLDKKRSNLPVGDYQAWLIPLICALNKALAARTRYYDSEGKLEQDFGWRNELAKSIFDRLGFSEDYSIRDTLSQILERRLKQCEDAEYDEKPQVKARISQLADRISRLKETQGAHYDPLFILPAVINREMTRYEVYDIETQLNLLDDQLAYLEKFAASDDLVKRQIKAEFEATEMRKKQEWESRVSELIFEIDELVKEIMVYGKYGDESIPVLRRTAEFQSAFLKKAKLRIERSVEEIKQMAVPRFFKSRYINAVVCKLEELVAYLNKDLIRETVESDVLPWDALPGPVTVGSTHTKGVSDEYVVSVLEKVEKEYRQTLSYAATLRAQANTVTDSLASRFGALVESVEKVKKIITQAKGQKFDRAELQSFVIKLLDSIVDNVGGEHRHDGT